MMRFFALRQGQISSEADPRGRARSRDSNIRRRARFQIVLEKECLAAVLAVLLLTTGATPVTGEQADTPPQVVPVSVPKLKILVLEGEGAINNLRRRTAREPVIQVVDENSKPVAGASVLFRLPEDGASGNFSNNMREIRVQTDAKGRASTKEVRLNNVQGQMKIEVIVSTQAENSISATSMLTQTNVVGPHLLLGAIPITGATVAIGGAVVAGIVAGAVKAAGGGTRTATVSIGAPHF